MPMKCQIVYATSRTDVTISRHRMLCRKLCIDSVFRLVILVGYYHVFTWDEYYMMNSGTFRQESIVWIWQSRENAIPHLHGHDQSTCANEEATQQISSHFIAVPIRRSPSSLHTISISSKHNKIGRYRLTKRPRQDRATRSHWPTVSIKVC